MKVTLHAVKMNVHCPWSWNVNREANIDILRHDFTTEKTVCFPSLPKSMLQQTALHLYSNRLLVNN